MTSKPRSGIARAWRRMRSIPGLLGNIVAVTALIVLAFVVSGVMFAESGASLPFSQQKVKVEFAEVPGVTVESSQKVKIAGVDVGTISASEPSDRGTAILTLSVSRDYVVHDNARAVLNSVNPLNQQYIELDPGGPPGAPLPPDAVIPQTQTSRPVQPDEILQKVDERTQKAIGDIFGQANVALARAPQDLPAGLRGTDATVRTLRPVVERLNTRRDSIRRLVTSLGQIAQAAGGNHQRALRLAEVTERTLGVLAQNDKELVATINQLPGLSTDLRRSLTATQGLTQQLDPTLDALNKVSDSLPNTLEKLTNSSENLGDVVDQARPVVQSARPLVSDLRPFVDDLDHALDDALPITKALDKDTAQITGGLTDLQAFVYNTSSVFGIEDATSGIIRGHIIAPFANGGGTLPTGGGFAPSPEENGLPKGPKK